MSNSGEIEPDAPLLSFLAEGRTVTGSLPRCWENRKGVPNSCVPRCGGTGGGCAEILLEAVVAAACCINFAVGDVVTPETKVGPGSGGGGLALL